MYKNFIFDLYGTLVDINTDESNDCFWEKVALFAGYNGAVYSAEEFREKYFELINLEEKKDNKANHEAFPEIQLDYIFKKMYNEKGIDAGTELCTYTAQCFRAFSTKYIKLYDNACDLLERIKKKGGKVYLLSNAQRVFTEYELKMLGLYDYFDDIFISSDYLCKKPDRKFMEKLLDKHNLDVKESIMIGNDLTTDILVAKEVDMDSFFIYSNLSPDMDFDEDEEYATFAIGEMDLDKVADMLEV